MHKRIRTLSVIFSGGTAWLAFIGGDFLFCAPACNTSAQTEKNTEAMAAQRMRREERNVKTALLQFVVREPISVILSWAAERDFAALPMNFEELKVSFALQKIPLTMKDGDATLSMAISTAVFCVFLAGAQGQKPGSVSVSTLIQVTSEALAAQPWARTGFPTMAITRAAASVA